MQSTNPVVNSYFSSGPEYHQINDTIESCLSRIETLLSGQGRRWGVSVLSGTGRALFGLVEIVAAVVYALFKFLEMFANRLVYGSDEALLSLHESMRALVYISHGIGNIVRGALEILQLCALTRARTQFFTYPTHQAWLDHRDALPDFSVGGGGNLELQPPPMQSEVDDDAFDQTS